MDIVSYEETKRGVDQVRMRINHEGTQGLVYVAPDGWEVKYGEDRRDGDKWHPNGSRGKQVRLSLNSPLRMTIAEWEKLRNAIDSQIAAL